jgi:hypothetical protein
MCFGATVSRAIIIIIIIVRVRIAACFIARFAVAPALVLLLFDSALPFLFLSFFSFAISVFRCHIYLALV